MTDLRERLADLAHEQWSGWMGWMLPKLSQPDAADWIARWTRQMKTPYAELSERERDSDRREADRVLAILTQERIIP